MFSDKNLCASHNFAKIDLRKWTRVVAHALGARVSIRWDKSRDCGRALALAGLILLAGAFGAIRDAVAATTVTDIRAGRHPDKIRLVLDLNGPVTFETFTLPDPYRVVVDLNEVKWAQSRPPRLGITEISNFRFGLFKPGTSRLVVDTTVPLAIAKTLLLAPTAKVKHHRLIIDLRRISQTRYRAEAMAALERRLQSRPPTTPAPPPSAARWRAPTNASSSSSIRGMAASTRGRSANPGFMRSKSSWPWPTS